MKDSRKPWKVQTRSKNNECTGGHYRGVWGIEIDGEDGVKKRMRVSAEEECLDDGWGLWLLFIC